MAGQIVQRALILHAGDGTHELRDLKAPEVLGPVDFGLHMQSQGDFLCIGSGVLAGSVIPGSNRLIFTGHSPVWDGFYVSTMGGAGLLWDGVGVSFLAIGGRAASPSVLVLSGAKGGDPKVRLVEVDPDSVWGSRDGPGGQYALQRYALEKIWDGSGTPRVLAVGPASRHTGMGAICSSRTSRGKLTSVDCWAGRGGFGSRLLQAHNLAAIVYGGDFEDEDLSDRAEADGYFQDMFSKKMLLEDLEATTKYRYDPKWKSGGTFGVNFSRLQDWMLSFNYRSVGWPKQRRRRLWEQLVRDHYLAQFNRETIEPRHFSHCGEPCPAVCKKTHSHYKKDYEPYQAMGPLTGIFDQRAAERVNHRADELGFDAIQIGGQLAWVMECLSANIVDAEDLGLPPGVPKRPVFEPGRFHAVADSEKNAILALSILELCSDPQNPLSKGMRRAARELGRRALRRAVYLANGTKGWMVPNQYWVPGMFAPMAVMGKYYVNYRTDFLPPQELGRSCADRMIAEVTLDNAGTCRFHRGWTEELWPRIVCGHYDVEIDYPDHHARVARRIHAQGNPVYWESTRIVEIIHGYLRRAFDAEPNNPVLVEWLDRFNDNPQAAARGYWEELRAGIEERMGEIPP
jgi:glyceraldehyde-3-phosphate dehydrogenase (ferredoxin)